MTAKKSPQEILKNKKDKLDWQIFNFLENMLVFCVLKSRSVPKESGVCFSITPVEETNGVCLLFFIDRKKDSLIKVKEVPRPDYLAFYFDSKLCICTIIEMKGRQEKNQKHGIEQITSLKEKLVSEINEHFPSKISKKIKFQAILLSPPNAQIPLKKIEESNKNGLNILPIQYNQKAELFNYISREVESNERYKHPTSNARKETPFIEKLFIEKALSDRVSIEPSNSEFNVEKSKERTGINIHYALEEEEEYLVLLSNEMEITIGIREKNGDKESKLKAEVNNLVPIEISKLVKFKTISMQT